MRDVADDPRILICTLYSGEPQLSALKDSLGAQSVRNWTQRIFEFLPNREAHRTLYRYIMDAHGQFDVFMKIDADMVLRRASVLEEIVERFARIEDLDHAVFAVHDWAAQRNIMGLHAFSPRALWKESSEALFVDPEPRIPGRRLVYWNDPEAVADHMPDPSFPQAYTFGFHRALKVVQRGRVHANVAQARAQMQLLQKVWDAFCATGDARRASVLQGADDAFRSHEQYIGGKTEWYSTEQHGAEESQRRPHGSWRVRCRWGRIGGIRNWRRLRWLVYPRVRARIRRLLAGEGKGVRA